MPATRRKKSPDRPHTPKRLTPEQESAQRKAPLRRSARCSVKSPNRGTAASAAIAGDIIAASARPAPARALGATGR
jgi:hypothetical protein